jgi:tripartite-type tricarboxylate transporter receptor subunit TctC
MKASHLLRLATTLLLTVVGFCASAQPAYPTKPIDIVVPYATGGSTDICARIIAKYVSQKKGVVINVVNKPGGGGLVGIREVLTSRPDGYTLMADTHGASSMVGAFNEPADVPFDWRNRTWIAMVDKDVVLYLVKEDSSWKTLKDVGAYAKQNPGKFRWASTGRGGVGIPAMQQFFDANGVPETVVASQVMFKSGGEGPVALAGGHVDFAAQQIAESLAMVQAKKIRAIAVVADKRLSQFPDVPTAAEQGYATFDVVGWHGLSGPPGLPANVVDWWVSGLKEASQDPLFLEMLEKVHKLPVFLGPADMKAFVDK